MDNLTSKEIALNYLKSVKKDYEKAYLEAIETDWAGCNTKIAVTLPLAKSISSLNDVIDIVKEEEDESNRVRKH